MVSFICGTCNATVKKPKVKSHPCKKAIFSCLDCQTEFDFSTVHQHTRCITEAEKYQGKLYKANKRTSSAATPASSTPSQKQAKTASPSPTVASTAVTSNNLDAMIVSILKESSTPLSMKDLRKKLKPLIKRCVKSSEKLRYDNEIVSLKK
ncbi:hypothetical protein GEMRC1_011719 [Eukaryota sp. GEM-RC1]